MVLQISGTTTIGQNLCLFNVITNISISDEEDASEREVVRGDKTGVNDGGGEKKETISEGVENVCRPSDSLNNEVVSFETVDELMQKRKVDLDTIAKNSPYSKFSKAKRTKFDDIRNILSSFHKVKDSGSQTKVSRLSLSSLQ